MSAWRRRVEALTTVLIIALATSPALQAQQPDYDANEESVSRRIEGELRLRLDRVDNLPGGRRVDRFRSHGQFGWAWTGGGWEAGAALRFALGSDSNDDNRRNLDNQESDNLDLGELYLRRVVGEASWLEVGQTGLPLRLTPLLWDHDLRPAGLSWQHERSLRDFDALVWTVGYWAPHHINEYESRLTAIQGSWRILEGAPRSGSITLSYLEFDDLEGLVTDGRARTNRVAGGRLVSDFELLDLKLQYRFMVWQQPVLATVDLVKNLGADDEDEGARFSLILGNGWNHGQWEFGYAFHRIQRDAVMAAFNDDDWWFPSRMRGWSPWLAYGVKDDLRLRLAGFVERRDDLDEHVERVLLDLTWLF